MKTRVAVIFAESIHPHLAGVGISILSRIANLQKQENVQIDAYCIQTYSDRFTSAIRREQYKKNRINKINVLGVDVNIKWVKVPLWYAVAYRLFGISPETLVAKRLCKQMVALRNYDIISAQSLFSGMVAKKIEEEYGIPYIVTWHGSDIHTNPFCSKIICKNTIDVIENSSYNIFVSKALMQTAQTITTCLHGCVVYNGVSDNFKRLDSDSIAHLRNHYKTNNKRVITYCGNLYPIKNVMALPEIFLRVKNKYGGDIIFWIIGDGGEREELISNLKQVEYRFFGRVGHNRIANLLNCTDVLVLPSKNEGLPLITLEALKCGANVVGSKVGGIPEAIGEENTFTLDNNFIENISQRIVQMLKEEITQTISEDFSWNRAAESECELYKEIISKNRIH